METSGIASAIAAALIEKRLRAGGTIEIPSLGIVLSADNLKEETPHMTPNHKLMPAEVVAMPLEE